VTRRLAVVAYPTFDDADRGWLESFREVHDPQARMLAAHFTLVFPTDVATADVRAELTEAVVSCREFAVVFRSAMAVPDPLGSGGHVFLVPDEGAKEVVDLHERLYRGAFRPSLRVDLPYRPHITVAAGPDMPRCETVAASLNRNSRVVRGHVEAIELLEVGRDGVASLGRFTLGHYLNRSAYTSG
jgi:2'-5' RNA ligase